ncbi:hypothetical protein NEIELOOT_01256 [Neisseria elongata subsp. glycolytica ATCC 29315]|uniref:Uncharacterized protein n=1 Tax=Neisseria elongata subsp. glycolytica ATCC 29315 TaxID=546263 RepID=D4DQC0_NEIEG|nr:hypothetical protein NEIELOOT_01256 [Neisseria elongata subsp. glycolytica ATCC 29315]
MPINANAPARAAKEEVVFICLLLSVKKRMNMPETVRQAVKGRLKAKFPPFRRPESYFLRNNR